MTARKRSFTLGKFAAWLVDHQYSDAKIVWDKEHRRSLIRLTNKNGKQRHFSLDRIVEAMDIDQNLKEAIANDE